MSRSGELDDSEGQTTKRFDSSHSIKNGAKALRSRHFFELNVFWNKLSHPIQHLAPLETLCSIPEFICFDFCTCSINSQNYQFSSKKTTKMGKTKKEKTNESVGEIKAETEIKEEDTYEEKIKNICAIASPLASKKLTKRIYKLIKKGLCLLLYHQRRSF